MLPWTSLCHSLQFQLHCTAKLTSGLWDKCHVSGAHPTQDPKLSQDLEGLGRISALLQLQPAEADDTEQIVAWIEQSQHNTPDTILPGQPHICCFLTAQVVLDDRFCRHLVVDSVTGQQLLPLQKQQHKA